jgi:hypothetical protein
VNLAAATTLAVRDRGGSKICAQLLCNQVLDDTMGTFAYKQFADKGRATGYKGCEYDSMYEAPSRATYLSGMTANLVRCWSSRIIQR